MTGKEFKESGMNCNPARLFCYKSMDLSLIFKKLSSWFIIIKVLKRKKANFGKFIKPFAIVSLNIIARFETYAWCFPNNRIFAITKPDPVDTERLTGLPMTAFRKDMPFYKGRFFRFHYHTLVNCRTGEILSFPGITYVKWQKMLSRRYTSILIVWKTARRQDTPEPHLFLVYLLSDRLCMRIPRRQYEPVFL